MGSIILKAGGPFSLKLTAMSHGFCQAPPFEWDKAKEELSMAVKLGSRKPMVITIKESREGALIKTGETLGLDEKKILKKTVAHCLRLDEDFSRFYEMCESEPKLKNAATHGAGRMLRSPNAFEDIVKSICGTNIAWSQAVKAIHAICRLGERAGEGDRRMFPTPKKISNAGAKWLRQEARVGYRAEYIIELCDNVLDRSLDLAKVDKGKLEGEELRKFFLSIKGIGKSTAHYLLMLHGEYSYLSIDSATHAFMKKLTGKKMTDSDIEKRYSEYGRWKALVLWYEWLSGSGWMEKV
ncbi:hypothetical protein MNBD_NITROSPINAE02-533 [hydrothermal vent metagenome]|uniref:DNA-(apurinic or apyrimidinic site) lyase n=1 Tax=hydrothermal vent metagenome TaxID=652676 RepID=A0A3B1CM33_9ZZZZ